MFPGEHVTDINDLIFDEPLDPNPVQTRNNDLQRRVAELEARLAESESAKADLQHQVHDLVDRNGFLSNHCDALEREVAENLDEQQRLQEQNQEFQRKEQLSEKKKVLGKKKLFDLSQSAVNQTKAALREHAVENLNSFARNRGIVVDQVIFQDEDGCQLTVNASRRNKYQDLNKEEKKRVSKASQWKDQNYVSDETYGKLGKVGTFPRASHVKSYEQEMNEKVGPILAVSARINTCKCWILCLKANVLGTHRFIYCRVNLQIDQPN